MKKFIFFWGNNSPFSNWHPSVFVHNGIKFNRGEQYMMYSKAMLFGDVETAQKILESNDPGIQKKLGRQVKDYNEDIWAEKRVDIMVSGLIEKFKQNPEMLKVLLDTGDDEIVEASPFDTVWGIGLTAKDPRSKNKEQWLGQNLLGITLMKVRDEICSS